ncbi:MAG: hypothetical protein A2742_03095 [Candidatus Yanofskybacteria bacterium RIFCSPHIGHO2_01_FULL_43_32]|nr:MAG: hypothetical protein A2742_03095 [Candidatus Yanofskybacteria bacterium RIFCSPHIGHO2_01_FULL_43_32]OGN11448.1 MAG: hypothetical protein A3C69_01200 [Candidatus Yanofskybacteria bacterium RIFCSPHIGHO2_02_FULL_43_12]OGN17473.1 MAG: hypothetical protein A3E34_02145 [Candidatus Yanofskybacteria bacterium RIFCSPHIGHO2_12_FULL_43_11]OGN24927.1 MAG: hypothetical protein A2923_02865 [Candidatus Yanofskybacteria bacterium RIFCSPLOWO2_01_FULL_43_46]
MKLYVKITEKSIISVYLGWLLEDLCLIPYGMKTFDFKYFTKSILVASCWYSNALSARKKLKALEGL